MVHIADLSSRLMPMDKGSSRASFMFEQEHQRCLQQTAAELTTVLLCSAFCIDLVPKQSSRCSAKVEMFQGVDFSFSIAMYYLSFAPCDSCRQSTTMLRRHFETR